MKTIVTIIAIILGSAIPLVAQTSSTEGDVMQLLWPSRQVSPEKIKQEWFFLFKEDRWDNSSSVAFVAGPYSSEQLCREVGKHSMENKERFFTDLDKEVARIKLDAEKKARENRLQRLLAAAKLAYSQGIRSEFVLEQANLVYPTATMYPLDNDFELQIGDTRYSSSGEVLWSTVTMSLSVNLSPSYYAVTPCFPIEVD